MTFPLREARLNDGHSIRSLSRALGINEAAIRRLEQGNGQGVHPATAKKIADHFGIQVTDLLNGETEQEPAA